MAKITFQAYSHFRLVSYVDGVLLCDWVATVTQDTSSSSFGMDVNELINSTLSENMVGGGDVWRQWLSDIPAVLPAGAMYSGFVVPVNLYLVSVTTPFNALDAISNPLRVLRPLTIRCEYRIAAMSDSEFPSSGGARAELSDGRAVWLPNYLPSDVPSPRALCEALSIKNNTSGKWTFSNTLGLTCQTVESGYYGRYYASFLSPIFAWAFGSRSDDLSFGGSPLQDVVVNGDALDTQTGVAFNDIMQNCLRWRLLNNLTLVYNAEMKDTLLFTRNLQAWHSDLLVAGRGVTLGYKHTEWRVGFVIVWNYYGSLSIWYDWQVMPCQRLRAVSPVYVGGASGVGMPSSPVLPLVLCNLLTGGALLRLPR